MFRNAFAFAVVASALAFTGCSKCSEQPAATDSAITAPVEAPVDAAAPAPGAEMAPAATPEPESPATK